MVTVLIPSPARTTYGINTMIYMMHEHKQDLLDVIKITRENEQGNQAFAFIAFFRDPGTIAHFTAVINHFGTIIGRQAGGTGSYGYAEMMSFLDTNQLETSDIEWDEIDSQLRERLDNPRSSMRHLYAAWTEFIYEHWFERLYLLLPAAQHPLTPTWRSLLNTM